ncbi:MAG: hypothetical protein QNJ97_25610 [Myxococcota bacterium]|nr:hypothetical protein [Myxococcota bacterium]
MNKMRKKIFRIVLSLGLTAVMAIAFACAEEGSAGTSPVDCGPNGSEHDGHCHCDSGYLFDGETCVDPIQITEVCGEHEADSDTQEQDHEHGACVCPAQEACPCDHGEIETIGERQYCVPELHEA